MPILNSTHLMTLTLDVDPVSAHQIGQTPVERRLVVPIIGGAFAGDRFAGSVKSGEYDWIETFALKIFLFKD